MSNVDKQTMDQVMELQHKTGEIRRLLAQITSQLQTSETERAILRVSLDHVETLTDETRMYRPVGKMFVLEPKNELKDQLNLSLKTSAEDSTLKTTLREQFVSKLKENESQADELLSQIEKASGASR